MSLVSGNNTSDLADVFHSVFEKHKIHLCVHFVVVTKNISKTDCQIINFGENVVNFIIEAVYEIGKY